MKIYDEILKNIVFVGIEYDGFFTPLGTGCLGGMEFDNYTFIYLATANHVVESIAGDVIYVRINLKGGGCETIRISKQLRMTHPDASNDIAIFPIEPSPGVHDVLLIRFDRANTERSRQMFWAPSLGDEVVTVGLYTSHYGSAKNLPVVRVGHIAALPDEPVFTEFGYVAAYLVETKSIAGLSGSPVYLSIPQMKVRGAEVVFSKEKDHPILGILVGYHVVETKEDQISVPNFKAKAPRDPRARIEAWTSGTPGSQS